MGNLHEGNHLFAGLPADTAAKSRWTDERIASIVHWTPRVLSFTTGRPADYRFSAGHYARVGLRDVAGELVWRPLSMVSAPAEDFLEFVAVTVPDGAFSSCLGKLEVGTPVSIDKSCFGFLTLDQLASGDDLWLLASGTGVGPFVAMLRDGAAWQKYRQINLVHSVRRTAELVYRQFFTVLAQKHPGFRYMPVVTREAGGVFAERIPDLIADGRLEAAAGVPLDVASSRVMVCGNPEMTRQLRELLTARGFAAGRRGVPGQMAFEKYW